MDHFTDEAWFDLVRKLLSPQQAQAMQRHLDEECQECWHRHELWRTVAEKASREYQYRPADSDLKIVKAAFREQMRNIVVPRIVIPATLTFDSLRDAVPSGFRAMLLNARHLVHHAGPWTIAIRLKAEPGKQMFVGGHVAKPGARGVEDIPVTLAHSGILCAQTRTNSLGEFYLQSRPERDMHIYIWISPDEALEVFLPPPD